MTRAAEWDSVRVRCFDEKGPARTLNRWARFDVQAMKDDTPRLSACTGRLAFPTSFQGAILRFCDLAGRSGDHGMSRLLRTARARRRRLFGPGETG